MRVQLWSAAPLPLRSRVQGIHERYGSVLRWVCARLRRFGRAGGLVLTLMSGLR